jgi:D-alanyl-D-alanine carboxypeptidase
MDGRGGVREDHRRGGGAGGHPRRRTVVLGLAVMAALLTAACSTSGTGSGETSDTTAVSGTAGLPAEAIAEVESYLDRWVAEGSSAGIMIQVTTPEGEWSHAVGEATTGPAAAPMELGLQHRIGSVTKTFTTTLALMLVEEGKLGLDDPVSQYVDGVPNGDQITVRMLGDMTSGLTEYLANADFRGAFFQDPERTVQAQELLDASYALGPEFAPGTSSAYSNTNTVLLGLVIEAVEGKPFGEVLSERILVPEGLDHTAYPSDASFPGGHVSGYSTLHPDHEEIDSTSWSPTQAQAAGQMISTVGDLTTWARLLGTGALISPELQAERLGWEPLGDNDDEWHYTFGIEENSGWLGHNGQIPGYFTYVVYHPELDATIVFAMNTDRNVDGEPAANVVMNDLSPILFPEHPVRVPKVGSPS